MFSKVSTLLSMVLLSACSQVYGYGMVQQIQGDNGVTPNGFGVKKTSDTSQASVSIIKGNTGCGTIQGATVDTATELEAAIKAGLPTTAADGTLNMVWFQQNAGDDGGGPGTAALDVTGTANSFAVLTITKNFADGGQDSANPMTIQVPAGTVCTGGSTGNACVAKVTNTAGPFGSCFAFTTPDSKAGTGAATPAAAGDAAPAIAAGTTPAATANAAPAVAAGTTPATAAAPATAVGTGAGRNLKKGKGKGFRSPGPAPAGPAAGPAAAKAKANNVIVSTGEEAATVSRRFERRHSRAFRA